MYQLKAAVFTRAMLDFLRRDPKLCVNLVTCKLFSNASARTMDSPQLVGTVDSDVQMEMAHREADEVVKKRRLIFNFIRFDLFHQHTDSRQQTPAADSRQQTPAAASLQ